jgi:hypothetical protein
MGNTPKYRLPYPELTDPPNVPSDVKKLADAVETALDSTKAVLHASSASPVAVSATVWTPLDVAVQDEAFNVAGWLSLSSNGILVSKNCVAIVSLRVAWSNSVDALISVEPYRSASAADHWASGGQARIHAGTLTVRAQAGQTLKPSVYPYAAGTVQYASIGVMVVGSA